MPLIINGNKFTWKRSEGSGSTFISDLNLSAWPGSFYVKSQRTGQQKLFLFYENIMTGRGEDRELGGKKYICPGQNLEVTVWND